MKEFTAKKHLAESKVKAVCSKIMEDKIRKTAGREKYDEIYKPITETLEDQKEILSSQLKALPDIKEHLALFPRNLVNKIQQTEAQTLYEEPIPRILPQPIEPVRVESLPEDDINKLFEDYEKEQETRDHGPKQFKIDLNKNVDLDLLDADAYYTPQEVFDFYHDSNEKMTREEIRI